MKFDVRSLLLIRKSNSIAIGTENGDFEHLNVTKRTSCIGAESTLATLHPWMTAEAMNHRVLRNARGGGVPGVSCRPAARCARAPACRCCARRRRRCWTRSSPARSCTASLWSLSSRVGATSRAPGIGGNALSHVECLKTLRSKRRYSW